MVPFAKNVANSFISPIVQISLIWFGHEGHLMQELTNDIGQVQRTLSIEAEIPTPSGISQGTNIGAGLELVDIQDTSTNKLVFIISDGCDNEYFKPNTRLQVKRLKDAGVEVYIIYIPSGGVQCPTYLKEIASLPIDSHYLPILVPPYYDNLNRPGFIDNLLSASCLQIDSVTPQEVCNSTRRTVIVEGKGFTRTSDLGQFFCRFQMKPCYDTPGWTDAAGNDCAAYGRNLQYCNMEGYEAALAACPVSCKRCTIDMDEMCADNPGRRSMCDYFL